MKRALALSALAILAAASTAGAQSAGEITALSLVPASGKADLVVAVRGTVQASDFTLREPARLVVDLRGARLAAGMPTYDGLGRGGIRNVRYAQFDRDVVRVVVELDALTGYEVQQGPGEVRIRLTSERNFAAWSTRDTPRPSAPLALSMPSPSRGGQAQGDVVGNQSSADEIAAYLADHAADAQTSQAPRMSVIWDSSSIAEVVQGFATFSGRSIILGRDVKGFVTAEIRNQPWDLAMNAVLESQGLAAEELPGGIIRVADKSILAKADSLEPLQTVAIRLNYARAGAMAATLKDIVSKGRGSVIADTSTNAIIFTDIVSRIDDDTLFARSLDIRTPQVSIQAKIIFVDRTNIEALGVRYDLGDDRTFFNSVVPRANQFELRDLDGDGVAESNVPTDFFGSQDVLVALGGNALAAVGNAQGNLGVGNSALDLIFSTAIGNFDLTSFVQALQTVQL
ncbi:MAG: AMIN domain-containing protein, partial [Gemmatimonadales bacterium]